MGFTSGKRISLAVDSQPLILIAIIKYILNVDEEKEEKKLAEVFK